MFRVMALDLWRDRPALAMTFLLPSIVFLIFSAVFSGATGVDVKLKVAVADLVHTPASIRLAKAFLADPDLRPERATPETLAAVREAVRSGKADAGFVIRSDPPGPGTPLLILSDPSRAVASPLTEARAREVLAAASPDVLLTRTIRDLAPATGPLSADQQDSVDAAVEQLVDKPSAAPATPPLFEHQDVANARRGGAAIAYYAGAVTILFTMFAATHGALTLIDERRSGIADRILAGRHGMGPVVSGKFLFLIVQGAAQAAVIFATAQVVYQVPVVDLSRGALWALQHFGLWLVVTGVTAAAAGGLALALVTLCRTREQAQMLSTFVIMILAAIGGSMVPRFLMPPWLQDLGWWTPHAWVIDAYQGLLWRDDGAAALYKAWFVLVSIGLAGFAVAQIASRRLRI
jgi:ABC-2 type transport system permease protein